MRMRPRVDHLLGSADIILVLLRAGYAHTCDRCARPVHVKADSGLCVWCFNGVDDERQPPVLPNAVVLRALRATRAAPPLEPLPA